MVLIQHGRCKCELRSKENCSWFTSRLHASKRCGFTASKKCALTLRSTGAPTAGHQARAGGTRYIFTCPGLASCRRLPVSSNVRQHKAAAATSRGAAAAAPYKISTGARPATTPQPNGAVVSQSPTRLQSSTLMRGQRERRAVQLLEETAMGGKQAQPHTSVQRTRNSESAEAQQTKHEEWFSAPATKFSSFLPLLAAAATIIFIQVQPHSHSAKSAA